MACNFYLPNTREYSEHLNHDVFMRMRRFDSLVIYQGRPNAINHTTTVVHPIMLDLLTERHYGEYGEESILTKIGSQSDLTITLQMRCTVCECLSDEHKEEHELVYAILIHGSLRFLVLK